MIMPFLSIYIWKSASQHQSGTAGPA